MFESVQLLCQLPYSHLQLLVLLLKLQGSLLGQQDPPAGLVPALPHSDVVPLASQPVLCAVLADAPLGHWGPQRWQEEGREFLEVTTTNVFRMCGNRVREVADGFSSPDIYKRDILSLNTNQKLRHHLLSVGVALVVVCAPCARVVA